MIGQPARRCQSQPPCRASRGRWLVLVLLALPPVALPLPIEPPPIAPPPVVATGDWGAAIGASAHSPAIHPAIFLARRDCRSRQSMVFGGPQPAVPRAGGGFGTSPPDDCDEPQRHHCDRAPCDPDGSDHPAYWPDADGDEPSPPPRARRKPPWAW